MNRQGCDARGPGTLDDIFAEPDPMGLLAVETQPAMPAAERQLRNRFAEIVSFVAQYGRAPDPNADAFEEARLGTRLAAIRASPDHVATLRESDTAELLTSPTASEPENQDSAASLDDVLASDDLGLLDSGDDSLFDLQHVPRYEERQAPDAIAQRRRCDDFYRFESLFARLREDLRTGDIETVRFSKETHVREGDAFVLGGMLCLVDSMGEKSQEERRFNPRLRVIFDNATESNLLMRSLTAALYKDENGRRVLQNDFVETFNNVSYRDQRVGTVYILRSLSERPEIQAVRHLYKIGYTEYSVESRIADAARDKTFLEAPVKVVSTFECYNVNPNRFERLIHAMLAHQRLNVTLRARSGETYRPREWFVVELNTAREVVRRIIDGSIVDYRIDNTTGRIVSKSGNTDP